jgi:hypothetical protein
VLEIEETALTIEKNRIVLVLKAVIIDHIISTLPMSNYIISTETHSPNTPSDQTAITIIISATLQMFEPQSCVIWAHTIWTSPDPNQVSVEQDLINLYILKKPVESPPSDINHFSEQLSEKLSKIQNGHTYTATQKPNNKLWRTSELKKKY